MEPIGQLRFRSLLRKEMKELAEHLRNNPEVVDAYAQNLASDLVLLSHKN